MTAAKKPATRKPAARKPTVKKATAARTEKSGQPKSFKWHGLTLALPPKMPGVFLWDMMEATGDGDEIAAMSSAVMSALGDTERAAIRAKIVEEEVSLDDMPETMGGLVSEILAAYGMTEGESSAS